MYMYVDTHTCTYIYVYVHTYVRTYIHTYLQMYNRKSVVSLVWGSLISAPISKATSVHSEMILDVRSDW